MSSRWRPVGRGKAVIRRILILLCCMSLCSVVAESYHIMYRSVPPPAAKVRAEDTGRVRRTVRDLGTLAPGEQSTVEIEMFNPSTAYWTVAGIVSDCGCLVYDLDWNAIGPGRSALVGIRFTAPQRPGPVVRSLVLQFKEDGVPEQVIDIKALVQPWCYSTPERVAFWARQNDPSQIPSQYVRLRLKRAGDIDTAVVPRAPDWLKVEYVDSDADPTGVSGEEPGEELVVRLSPTTPKGSEQDAWSCVVSFESKTTKERLELPVQFVETSSFEVFPDVLFLGKRKQGESFERLVRIRGFSSSLAVDENSSTQRFRVDHDLGSQLDLKVMSGKVEDEVLLRCRFTMARTDTYLSGHIRVLIGRNGNVTIPVTGRVVADGILER